MQWNWFLHHVTATALQMKDKLLLKAAQNFIQTNNNETIKQFTLTAVDY